MKGVPWYSHGTLNRDREALKKLRQEYGAEGYGVYVLLKEMIGQRDGLKIYYNDIVKEVWAELEFYTDGETVGEIIDLLLEEKVLIREGNELSMPELEEDTELIKKQRTRRKAHYHQHTPGSAPREEKEYTAEPSPVAQVIQHNKEVAERILGFAPPLNFGQVTKLIKARLNQFSVEQVCEVISAGYEDEMIIKFNIQNIETILAAKHFTRILANLKRRKKKESKSWKEIETPLENVEKALAN